MYFQASLLCLSIHKFCKVVITKLSSFYCWLEQYAMYRFFFYLFVMYMHNLVNWTKNTPYHMVLALTFKRITCYLIIVLNKLRTWRRNWWIGSVYSDINVEKTNEIKNTKLFCFPWCFLYIEVTRSYLGLCMGWCM
jgi:hypothetical protein